MLKRKLQTDDSGKLRALFSTLLRCYCIYLQIYFQLHASYGVFLLLFYVEELECCDWSTPSRRLVSHTGHLSFCARAVAGILEPYHEATESAPTPKNYLSHGHICKLVSMLEEILFCWILLEVRWNAFQLTGNRKTKIKIYTSCGF